MRWTVKWTPRAWTGAGHLGTWASARLARGVQSFADTGAGALVRDTSVTGQLTVDRWEVDLLFERGASLVDEDGESLITDILWVMSVEAVSSSAVRAIAHP